jgi:hypothetical protein
MLSHLLRYDHGRRDEAADQRSRRRGPMDEALSLRRYPDPPPSARGDRHGRERAFRDQRVPRDQYESLPLGRYAPRPRICARILPVARLLQGRSHRCFGTHLRADEWSGSAPGHRSPTDRLGETGSRRLASVSNSRCAARKHPAPRPLFHCTGSRTDDRPRFSALSPADGGGGSSRTSTTSQPHPASVPTRLGPVIARRQTASISSLRSVRTRRSVSESGAAPQSTVLACSAARSRRASPMRA